MKFDTVILGGGLAGLICGITLAKQNQRCAIISTGQSALHFSSGSFDLLNAMPSGDGVTHPMLAHREFVKQAPCHPYAQFSETQFFSLAEQAEGLLQESGLLFYGHAKQNHYRLTPIGKVCPTWLTINDAPTMDDPAALPWQKILLVDIVGFLDFQPQMMADRLQELGASAEIIAVELPELAQLRKNPSEFRSINIANLFDHQPSVLQKLAEQIREHSGGCDAILLPACLGLFNSRSLETLTELCQQHVYLLPTLPPSLLGMKIYHQLIQYYKKLGGYFELGDAVMSADSENHRVTRIYTRNHTDIPFIANQFVLATGSFFSHGLASTRHEVFEPIFNADVDVPADREAWSKQNFFEKQPYIGYGVKTGADFRVMKNGELYENLYAIGAILSGSEPIQQGCGAGVTLLSALHVANHICQQGDA